MREPVRQLLEKGLADGLELTEELSARSVSSLGVCYHGDIVGQEMVMLEVG